MIEFEWLEDTSFHRLLKIKPDGFTASAPNKPILELAYDVVFLEPMQAASFDRSAASR